jgi:hydroxymethylpyrimidine/phosphomethylpyrimidine kinase
LLEGKEKIMKQKTVLTIAGSDPSGGAGIQADLKTMEAFDVYGMSVITALTAQNTLGVSAVMNVEPAFVEKQLEAVLSDIQPDAVKIGMLPDRKIMEVVCKTVDKYKIKNIVLDPVLSSTSGTELSRNSDLEYMIKELFKRCTLITPNIPEAEVLCGSHIGTVQDMEEAAGVIGEKFGTAVLLKGGHAVNEANDLLYSRGELEWFQGKRIDNPNTHGTGCTMSSAFAAMLAKGKSLGQAAKEAKDYVANAILSGAEYEIGHGHGPVCHLTI